MEKWLCELTVILPCFLQICEMLLSHLDSLFQWDLHRAKRIASLHDLSQVLVGKMGVQIDGYRTIGMTEDLGDGLDVRSLLDGHGSEAVPESVRSYRSPQSCLFQVFFQNLLGASGTQGLELLCADEEELMVEFQGLPHLDVS